MQDDGIHANLIYTQQAYVATVMCNFLIVTFCIPCNYLHVTWKLSFLCNLCNLCKLCNLFVSENYLSAKNNFLRHLKSECQ